MAPHIKLHRTGSGAGFSLIEMLVVIAVIGVLASAGFTGYTTFKTRTTLSSAAAITAQAIRQASLNAQNGRRDSVWRVDVSTTGTIIYAGSTYTGRIVGSEISATFPSALTVSGTATYTFAKLTGRPTTPGTTTLKFNTSSSDININALGTVTN